MKTVNIKIWVLFLIGLFLFSPIVNASLSSSGNITFSVNQKDYYFKTGEAAIIPMNIENTYGKQIDGMLTYTYTQEINQGGMHMSSSNSQSTSLSVKDGKTTQDLNFGTSDSPSELNISLKFIYTEKESRVVNLDGIKIHFVSDENQKQNQQNKQSSSSEKYTGSQQPQNSGQNTFSQMQQQLNQMMNNNQQPQNSQQALQNNQMAQDSSALKQQMENQIKEQEAMKQEFQKQLAQNQEFQKEHQKLLSQGYNLTNANVNPSSNNTGDFKLNYQNKNGEQASLKGHMNNGKMQSLQKDTPESRQETLNQLQQNKQFQEYQKQLQKQGYSKQNTEVSQEQNKTNVKVNYANQNNETASITAQVTNNTVKNVELNNGEKEKKNYWWIIPLLILIALLGYFAYKKYHKKPEFEKPFVEKKKEKPFDYKSESVKLLEESKKLFEQKQYKDAYGTAGQALRLFLSYENKLNKEITNDEIINYLKKHKQGYKEAKECFDLCSLVEFAKYEANKKDFDKIINHAKKIIE